MNYDTIKLEDRYLQICKDKGNESSFGDAIKWAARDYSGTLYYLKSRLKDNTYDIESEVIASKLANLFNLKAVQYSKSNIIIDNREIEVCISEDYAKGKQQKSISKFLRRDLENLKGKDKFYVVADFTDSLDSNWIDKLILFDYIINNEDRHLNNIEVLISGDNSIELAPVFDNGSSLFYDKELFKIKNSLKNDITYRKSKPFFSNHTEQIKLLRKPPTELLPRISKVAVYKIVNQTFGKNIERAELICKWLITRLKELDLLCEQEQISGQSIIESF